MNITDEAFQEMASRARLWVRVFSADGKISAAVMKCNFASRMKVNVVAGEISDTEPVADIFAFDDGAEICCGGMPGREVEA